MTRSAKLLRRRVYEKRPKFKNIQLNVHSNSENDNDLSETMPYEMGYASCDEESMQKQNYNFHTEETPLMDANQSPSENPMMDGDDNDDAKQIYIDRCINELVATNLLRTFVTLLGNNDCLHDFMQFINLIVKGKMQVMNIPFLLLLDLARFLSCKTTVGMKYRVQTRQFWEAVYRFGGGTVIRLLSGLKNFGQLCTKQCRKSLYDPLKAIVNFAVPDIKLLAKTVGPIKDKVKCGFIQECIDRLDKSKEYVLSFDGKKVSPGCSEDEGDIFLFGLEGPPSLQERNERLNNEKNYMHNLIHKEEENSGSLQTKLDNLEEVLKIASRRIMDQRVTTVNQEMLKVTFQKAMEKDASTITKYTNAIASIDLCQVFSADVVNKILQENKYICSILARMRNNYNNFVDGVNVDLQKQGNCITLRPPETIDINADDELLPQYTKQGTTEWLEIRKQAVITASTAYASLGLDTQKKQKQLFDERVLGKQPEPITEELQRRFDHGRKNEIHAFGTLAGVVLPSLMPNCKSLVQVGSFFINGINREKLAVVSPDGFVTTHNNNRQCSDGLHGSDDDYSVEIKSPMGENPLILPVHYKIPKYYVPQVLLQMKVLKVKKGLFASIGKNSVVVLLVHFDVNLWSEMWKLTRTMYDKVTLKKLIKCSAESTHLKQLIDQFILNGTELLCEVPVSTTTEGNYGTEKFPTPFRFAASTNRRRVHPNELKVEIIHRCEIMIKLIEQCHEMQRRKATELLMICVNDTDRIFDPDSYHALPIAYLMKGYSLDVKTMREIIDMVMDKLKAEGIKVVCTAFDGQWHNMAVKDKHSQPLTRLQLQKYVWAQLGRITKENLLKTIDSWTIVKHEDIENCANSVFLTVGNHVFGNLSVSFHRNSRGQRVLSCHCMDGTANFNGVMRQVFTPQMKHRPELWMEDYYDEHCMQSKTDTDILKINRDANVITLLPGEFLQSNTIQSAVHDISDSNTDDSDYLPDIPTSDGIASSDTNYVVADDDVIGHSLLNINKNFLEQILVGLCSEKRSDIWSSYGIDDLYNGILRNQQQISKLTSYEMNVIDNVFFSYKKKHLFRHSDLKAKKVKVLCKLFGRKRTIHKDPVMNTKRISLRKLAIDAIKDIDYPTVVLAVALANAIHSYEMPLWYSRATLPMKIQLPQSDTVHIAFSYPEFSVHRNQLEPKLLDPTHILTNMRTHICTKGYDMIKRDAFLRVSEADNDVLNRAYIVNLVDKQSAPIALKFFSLDVQSIMLQNNDVDESDFVGIVRNWYEAVDERGIPVVTRLAHMQTMYEFLNGLVNFDHYPPKSKYIGGIPIVTFEAILQNISTRIQLYGICSQNMYNNRSLSTLAIEALFGHLSRMEGSYNGCPKSTSVSTMLKWLVQMFELQTNPEKLFSIHVSHRKKYPEHDLLSEDTENSTEDNETDDSAQPVPPPQNPGVYQLVFQNHQFDRRIRRRRSKRKKNFELNTGNRPLRRESGVRVNFKTYESKIKSTTRHGLRL